MEKVPYNILETKDYLNIFPQENETVNPKNAGIPLLDVSDKDIMELYYYRWYTFFSHIRNTADGYVVTEFLQDVPWAGKHNTINCPLGHQLYEGRWIHNREYLSDYTTWWFRGGDLRQYSTWFADAVVAMAKVSGDFSLAERIFEELKNNYLCWEKEKLLPSGMFYQIDNLDGMEYSISGSGERPTLNSYMYGDLMALSRIAERRGDAASAKLFKEKAEALRNLINSRLWDEKEGFYKTRSEEKNYELADVKELCGYIPWYFGIPEEHMSSAWRYLNDKNVFYGKFGPTSAERSHPDYMKEFDHECLWNGPSWPYLTSMTLVGMANLINDYKSQTVTKSDYLELLHRYAVSQHLTLPSGERVPFIDEDLHPDTGAWIARDILRGITPPRNDAERGEKYNHSTFCDLVITGLAGIRPSEDGTLRINPLFEADELSYMCLDGVLYHGRYITVIWDADGSRYGRGKGFFVLVDGKVRAEAPAPCRVSVKLEDGENPSAVPSKIKFRKYENNPIFGDESLGTCFDAYVTADGARLRMDVSLRRNNALAVTFSDDGIHWCEPEITLAPDENSGWETRVNRNCVIKVGDIYKMYYTGQSSDESYIGYAESTDGIEFHRVQAAPVLSPEFPWEKKSVMNPCVIYENGVYRMWYAGGEFWEPDALGYAESLDGIHFTKHGENPIFTADTENAYEQDRVGGCQVIKTDEGYLMLYIGFADIDHGCVCAAFSRDGVNDFRRLSQNPIIVSGESGFDSDSCYKPTVMRVGDIYRIWYNGRNGDKEYIGLAEVSGLTL